MPPVDPQSIPFAPAPSPQPFQSQAGPMASIQEQANARVPTTMDIWKTLGEQTNQQLQSYLEQQRLRQQAPLMAAQTKSALAQAADVQAQAAERTRAMHELYDVPTPTTSGTSPSSSSQLPTDFGMQPQANAFGGIPSGPNQNMSSAGPQNDPFAHMHMPAGMNTTLYGAQPTAHPATSQPQDWTTMTPAQVMTDPTISNYQRQQRLPYVRGNVIGQSPIAQSIFGPNAGQMGLTPEDITRALVARGELNIKAQTMANNNARLKNESQGPAIAEAGKMYNDYVGQDQNVQAAKQALAKSQENPALFNTALFNVGKALGVTSRNPELVIQTISAGDPSLAGQIKEYMSTKGGGKVSPELLRGLNGMMDDIGDSNRQGFEAKANAHAQQYADRFGGSDTAKQQLFPQYQWNRQAGQGGTPTRNAGTQGTAGSNVITVKTSDGRTQQIFAANLAAAKKRDAGLQVIQ